MIFNQYYDFVNKSLSSFVDSLGESSIYDPIKYFLDLPSKRIRPIATLISNKLFNDDDDFAIHAALANEVFHNFTLVHDDIICLLYTSPSPRDKRQSRMPSSA